jgi:hypothetical protein
VINFGERSDRKLKISLLAWRDPKDNATKAIATVPPTNGDRGTTSETASNNMLRAIVPNQTAIIKRSQGRSKQSAFNQLRTAIPIVGQTKISIVQTTSVYNMKIKVSNYPRANLLRVDFLQKSGEKGKGNGKRIDFQSV